MFHKLLHIDKQFRVGKYNIDWYIQKYNIVIECDENDHSGYFKYKDKLRTDLINTRLNNPVWIRFNPNDINFNVGNIINQILQYILKDNTQTIHK